MTIFEGFLPKDSDLANLTKEDVDTREKRKRLGITAQDADSLVWTESFKKFEHWIGVLTPKLNAYLESKDPAYRSREYLLAFVPVMRDEVTLFINKAQRLIERPGNKDDARNVQLRAMITEVQEKMRKIEEMQREVETRTRGS